MSAKVVCPRTVQQSSDLGLDLSDSISFLHVSDKLLNKYQLD